MSKLSKKMIDSGNDELEFDYLLAGKTSAKVRYCCITINNIEPGQIDAIREAYAKGKITYYVIAFEYGKNMTLHIQGYLEFKCQVTFATVNKLLAYEDGSWPHSEKRGMNSCQKQAIDYCKKGIQSKAEWKKLHQSGPNFGKEAKFEEDGIPKPGQGTRTDIETAKCWMKEGLSMEEILERCNNYQVSKYVENFIHMFEPQKTWKPIVRWFWGESGCSKSHTAKLQAGYIDSNGKPTGNKNVYIKPQMDRWWPKYDGQELVIIDELRANIIPCAKLLSLLGSEPDMVENKGKYRQFRAKEIWITTSKCPEEFYKNYKDEIEDIKQLIRRINGEEKDENGVLLGCSTHFNIPYETVNFELHTTSQEEEMAKAQKISDSKIKSEDLIESDNTINGSEVAGNSQTATQDYKCPLSDDARLAAKKRFDDFLVILKNKKLNELSNSISEIISESSSSEETEIVTLYECLKCKKWEEKMSPNENLCIYCYKNTCKPKKEGRTPCYKCEHGTCWESMDWKCNHCGK
nr:putative replication associated protein [Crucivirus sp.]